MDSPACGCGGACSCARTEGGSRKNTKAKQARIAKTFAWTVLGFIAISPVEPTTVVRAQEAYRQYARNGLPMDRTQMQEISCHIIARVESRKVLVRNCLPPNWPFVQHRFSPGFRRLAACGRT